MKTAIVLVDFQTSPKYWVIEDADSDLQVSLEKMNGIHQIHDADEMTDVHVAALEVISKKLFSLSEVTITEFQNCEPNKIILLLDGE